MHERPEVDISIMVLFSKVLKCNDMIIGDMDNLLVLDYLGISKKFSHLFSPFPNFRGGHRRP